MSAFVTPAAAALVGDRGTFHGSRSALRARSVRLAPRVARASANPSWTDHKPVAEKPTSLVRETELAAEGEEGMRVRFERMIRKAQDDICAQVQALDGGTFKEDVWIRENGGGGISRVIQNKPGEGVFEKAGCRYVLGIALMALVPIYVLYP